MDKDNDQLTVRELRELFSIHHDDHRSSDLYCNLASTCTHMNNPLIGSKTFAVNVDCICFEKGEENTILQPKISGVKVTPSVTSGESS